MAWKRSWQRGKYGKGARKGRRGQTGGQLVLWKKKNTIVLIQPVKHRQAKGILGAGTRALEPGSPLSFSLLLSVENPDPHLNNGNFVILYNRKPRGGTHSRIS